MKGYVHGEAISSIISIVNNVSHIIPFYRVLSWVGRYYDSDSTLAFFAFSFHRKIRNAITEPYGEISTILFMTFFFCPQATSSPRKQPWPRLGAPLRAMWTVAKGAGARVNRVRPRAATRVSSCWRCARCRCLSAGLTACLRSTTGERCSYLC